MYLSRETASFPYAKEVTKILELLDVNFDGEVSMEIQKENLLDLSICLAWELLGVKPEILMFKKVTCFPIPLLMDHMNPQPLNMK